MKRIVPLLLCAIMIFTMLPVQAKADDVTINVYNWGQYISDGTDGYIDVNKAFTEKTGIKVNYMTSIQTRPCTQSSRPAAAPTTLSSPRTI